MLHFDSDEARVLRGHCLTREEAAGLAGMSPTELATLPGTVRIDGPYPGCDEAYPAYQFAPGGGFVPGLRDVVCAVHDSLDELSLAGFLTASHPGFGGRSIVDTLCTGCGPDEVLRALAA